MKKRKTKNMVLREHKLTASIFLIILYFFFANKIYSHGEDVISELTAFRNYKDVTTPAISVPTVVEIPFSGEYLERNTFAVYENETSTFQPYFFNVKSIINTIQTIISSVPVSGDIKNIADNRYDTYTEYALPETYNGVVRFSIIGEKPIVSSSLSIVLENNTAMPTFIEIRAGDRKDTKIVLARKRMLQGRVVFPKTEAIYWDIKLEYAQPLRISEMHLIQEDVEKASSKNLRFLARPNNTYKIYFNPDREISIKTSESGDLSQDKNILSLSMYEIKINELYKAADIDGDGIEDKIDNCVYVVNPKQTDIDGNNRGDDCDDFDRDWIINSKDNCIDYPNRMQGDIDGDGIGDACDGEESRITEKYVWLPWFGMSLVAVVIFILLFLTIKGIDKKKIDDMK